MEKQKIYYCTSYKGTAYNFAKENKIILQLSWGEEYYSEEKKQNLRIIRSENSVALENKKFFYAEPGYESVILGNKKPVIFGVELLANGEIKLDENKCTDKFSWKQISVIKTKLRNDLESNNSLKNLLKHKPLSEISTMDDQSLFGNTRTFQDREGIFQLIKTKDEALFKRFVKHNENNITSQLILDQVLPLFAARGMIEETEFLLKYQPKDPAVISPFSSPFSPLQKAFEFRQLKYLQFYYSEMIKRNPKEFEKITNYERIFNFTPFPSYIGHLSPIISTEMIPDAYGTGTIIQCLQELDKVNPKIIRNEYFIYNFLKEKLKHKGLDIPTLEYLLSLQPNQDIKIIEKLLMPTDNAPGSNSIIRMPWNISQYLYNKYMKSIAPDVIDFVQITNHKKGAVDSPELQRQLLTSIYWGQNEESIKLITNLKSLNYCSTILHKEGIKLSPLEIAIFTSNDVILNSLLKRKENLDFQCEHGTIEIAKMLSACDLLGLKKIIEATYFKDNKFDYINLLILGLSNSKTLEDKKECYELAKTILAKNAFTINEKTLDNILVFGDTKFLEIVLKASNAIEPHVFQKSASNYENFLLYEQNLPNWDSSSYNNIVRTLTNNDIDSTKDQFKIKSNIGLQIIKVGIPYPICGSQSEIKTYADNTGKKELNVIVSCQEVEAQGGRNNLAYYIVIKTENGMMMLKNLHTEHSLQHNDYQRSSDLVWIKTEDFSVPFWLSDGRFFIALPFTAPLKIVRARKLLSFTGNETLCDMSTREINSSAVTEIDDPTMQSVASFHYLPTSKPDLSVIVPVDFNYEKAILYKNPFLNIDIACKNVK